MRRHRTRAGLSEKDKQALNRFVAGKLVLPVDALAMLTAGSLSGSRSKGKGNSTMTKSTLNQPFDACNVDKVAHEMFETPQPRVLV